VHKNSANATYITVTVIEVCRMFFLPVWCCHRLKGWTIDTRKLDVRLANGPTLHKNHLPQPPHVTVGSSKTPTCLAHPLNGDRIVDADTLEALIQILPQKLLHVVNPSLVDKVWSKSNLKWFWESGKLWIGKNDRCIYVVGNGRNMETMNIPFAVQHGKKAHHPEIHRTITKLA